MKIIRPVGVVVVQFVLFIMSLCFKVYMQNQVFKTESHPYYQIN